MLRSIVTKNVLLFLVILVVAVVPRALEGARAREGPVARCSGGTCWAMVSAIASIPGCTGADPALGAAAFGSELMA